MHILILTQYFPPEIGAAQARLEYYAKYFNMVGHQVTVLTTFPNYPDGKVFAEYNNNMFFSEKIMNITVIRTALWEDGGKGATARLKWFLSVMVSTLLGAMKLKKPDVILVENPPLFLGITAALLRKIWGVPVINHLSDLWVEAAINFGFLKSKWMIYAAKMLEKLVLRSCDGIAAVSDKVYAHALSFQNESNVRLLPNGVDINVYQKREPDEKLIMNLNLKERFIITYAGTLGFQHGLDVIVQAAKILKETSPKCIFLFIGEGSEKARIQQMVTDLKLENVLFVPAQPQEQLVEYLNISHVGISTLKDAKFTLGVRPVKIFSYMACELPIVYTEIGESKELLSGIDCGVGVPPDDPQLIAEAIISLNNNSNLLSQMGRSGRKVVEAKYSREYSASLLLEFMQEKAFS